MEKLLLLIIISMAATCTYAQNLTDKWVWQSTNGDHMFEMSLEETSTNILKGHHCGVFRQGKKLDCMPSDQEYSIELTKEATNVYQGTIFSTYSTTEGVIKLTYNSTEDKIHFERVEAPDGESYRPDDIILERR